MIALVLTLLPTDPLLAAAAERAETPPYQCPVDVLMRFSAGEEEETQRLRIDPVTGDAVPLDENGDPIEPEEPAPEVAQSSEEEEDGGTSVSLSPTDYETVRTRLDLPLDKVSEAGGVTVYASSSLPKDTVLLADKDLSKNTTITLTVDENNGAPFVSRYTERLDKPVRMKTVAKVKSFEKAVDFGMVRGEPRPLVEDMATAFSVFGNEQNMMFRMEYDYPACDD